MFQKCMHQLEMSNEIIQKIKEQWIFSDRWKKAVKKI